VFAYTLIVERLKVVVAFTEELEPAGAHGDGVVFRRLPSVKTQLLKSEGVRAGQLFTSTPRLVQKTGLPTFVVLVEAVVAL
jgi:hypothetical protein